MKAAAARPGCATPDGRNPHEHAKMADLAAMSKVSCPVCGALPGSDCKGSGIHDARGQAEHAAASGILREHDPEAWNKGEDPSHYEHSEARSALSLALPVIISHERQLWQQVLADHYLTGVTCDPETKRDNPVCACSVVFLGWHRSVGEAVRAWIDHVGQAMEELS